MEPWKARQLVNRYLTAANEGFSELEAPQSVETASAGRVVRPPPKGLVQGLSGT